MGLLTVADWKDAQWIAYEKIADSNRNILPVDGKKDTFKENNILPILRKSFYCAVNQKDQGGIAVATSKELGKSKVNFVGK